MKKFFKIGLLGLAGWVAIWIVYSTSRLPIAEYKWKKAGIRNYEIKVRSQSAWHSQIYIVKVRNGQIVQSDSYCEKAAMGSESDQCVVKSFDPVDYTVEGLFEQAEQAGNADIEFDNIYQFPVEFYKSGPMGAFDAWWGLFVISFNVVP